MRLVWLSLVALVGCSAANKEIVRHEQDEITATEDAPVPETVRPVVAASPPPPRDPAYSRMTTLRFGERSQLRSSEPATRSDTTSAQEVSGYSVEEVVIDTPMGKIKVRCPKPECPTCPDFDCKDCVPEGWVCIPKEPETPMWKKVLEEALKPMAGAIGAWAVAKLLSNRRKKRKP